jgi:archaellum component FlaC
MTLTQQDLEAIKEVIENELVTFDNKFERRFISIEDKLDNVQKDVIGLREQIQSLTTTLDNFLKRLIGCEEKFGVEIAIQ